MGAVRAKSKKTRSGPGRRCCSKATSPSKSSVSRIVSPIVVRRSPRSVASRPVASGARIAVPVSVSSGIDTDTGAGGGVGRATAGAVLAAAGDAFAAVALADASFADVREPPTPSRQAAGHGGAAARAPPLPASWTDSAARACRGTARRACDRPAAGRRDRRRAPPWPPATARCRRTRCAAWRRAMPSASAATRRSCGRGVGRGPSSRSASTRASSRS